MERKQKHIMAIGAHIGDAELTCGKTLAKHAKLGDRITTVALTAGERGHPPTIPEAEFRQQNIDSAHAFATMLGGRFILIEGHRDGEIPNDEAIRMQICDVIRREKPDVILTHWSDSLHKDHVTASKVVEDAIFYAALPDIQRQDAAHWANGPYYAENWEDSNGFVPYLFINVTEGYDLWHEAIQKLWLTNNSPWFKYLQYYEGLSQARGALCKAARAECFAVSPYSKKLVQDAF